MTASADNPASASGGSAPTRAAPGRPLTGGEQSRLSWARVAESIDEIPPVYRGWLDPLLHGREPFPRIVLTPTYEGYFRRANEKLVCILDRTLHIVERAGERLYPIAYSLEEISRIEVGAILLQGWITVHGRPVAGPPSLATIRFNTVTYRLFAPLVSEFRQGPQPAGDDGLDVQRAKFLDLLDRNYKFMNFARGSIMPGEEVRYYLHQPEIREQLLRLFGRTLSRCISPTHIAIVTDRELIAISEEGGSLWQSFGTVKYGGVWQYIPRQVISDTSITARANGLLALSLQLAHADELELLFSSTNGRELDTLVGYL